MGSKRVNLKNHLNRRIKAANKLDHPLMTAAWNKLGIKIWCFDILKAKCETSQKRHPDEGYLKAHTFWNTGNRT